MPKRKRSEGAAIAASSEAGRCNAAASEKMNEPLGTAKNGDAELSATLRGDLTSIRGICTCTICDQLLYEPWTLGCGHTYCYGCLCAWLTPNKKKKTCPECRAPVKSIPAPSFLIKQMVEVVIKQASTMPADESFEQHSRLRKEETERVENDRAAEAGVFPGAFSPTRLRLGVIFDEEDGVYRCPNCNHEHEGGPRCANCGEIVDPGYEFSESDDYDSEAMGMDIEVEMRAGHMEGVQGAINAHIRNYGPAGPGLGSILAAQQELYDWGESDGEEYDSTDDLDDDEDGGSEMDDFIVQDGPTHARTALSRNGNAHINLISSEEPESEDEASDVVRPRAFTGRRRVLPAPSSTPGDLSSSDSSSDPESSAIEEDLRRDGWSPLHHIDGSDDDDDDDNNQNHGAYPESVDEDSDNDTINNMEDALRDRLSETPRYEAPGTPYDYSSTDEEGSQRRDFSAPAYEPYDYDSASNVDNISDDQGETTDADDDTDMNAHGIPPRGSSVLSSGGSASSSAERYQQYQQHSGGIHAVSSSAAEEEDSDDEPVVAASRRRPEASRRRAEASRRQDLGEANVIHLEEESVSDESVTPAPRRHGRRALRLHGVSNREDEQVETTDPRISSMFAAHQHVMRPSDDLAAAFDTARSNYDESSTFRERSIYRHIPPYRPSPALGSNRINHSSRPPAVSLARDPRQGWDNTL